MHSIIFSITFYKNVNITDEKTGFLECLLLRSANEEIR